MEESIERAAARAIVAMREGLGEQLTVDDMARAAMFSKFHFSRIFQRATGLSPGRFLSALRLQYAKHLLVSTSLNVADICLRVGYNSVGTFSSRFSKSVGMSPTTYRRCSGFAEQIPTVPAHRVASTARLYGNARLSQLGASGPVFIGLFPDRIPEGRPARCTILPAPGPYSFDTVPPGTWYLLAQSVSGDWQTPPLDPADAEGRVSVATYGPITVRRDTVRADLTLKPARDLDPPVLLALTDARELALATAAERTEGAAPSMLVSSARSPHERALQRPAA
ncbi:helix-turn-helix domain-containing protein [Phytohabitans flavus]|uniref:helix-turn-helix domain-containing protein n=1 Tax=Phytohabitans flavus TaxID=1076124 RepID=UPI001565B493|nr:helix-turn-helix transcriptional regulator [Phytohabitans flavus]